MIVRGMENWTKHKQFISMIATLCMSHFLLYSSFPSLEHVRKRILWISCYIVKYRIKKKGREITFVAWRSWSELRGKRFWGEEWKKRGPWVGSSIFHLICKIHKAHYEILLCLEVFYVYMLLSTVENSSMSTLWAMDSTPTCDRFSGGEREILINPP